jgi:hypothetical protein
MRLATKAFLAVMFGASATFACSTAHAKNENPPIKNGQPCFAEVCAGDDLSDLRNIPWGEIGSSEQLKGHLFAITVSQKLDVILAARSACQLDSPRAYYALAAYGSFTSKSGYPTSVSFRAVPDEQRGVKFIVNRIVRTFPWKAFKNDDDIGQFRSSIDERYARAGQAYKWEMPPPLRISLIWLNNETQIEMWNKQLENSPGCDHKPVSAD